MRPTLRRIGVGVDPLEHWVDHGYREWRNPSENFDLEFYARLMPPQYPNPLVHYMTQDLYDFLDSTNSKYNVALPPPTIAYIGHQSDRYMPWSQGGNLDNSTFYGVSLSGASAYDLSYRDPLVWSSDNWDFPTNKYPTVGWLGRVHRGTPWQSVYLKSSDVLNESANQ